MKRRDSRDVVEFTTTLLLWIACLCLALWAAAPQAGGPEQTVFGGAADGAPWYVVLAIVCGPGLGAVLLTIATVTMIRRINRADSRKPFGVLQAVLWTLGIGAGWGPAIQWATQELVTSLTGIPPNFKLIVIAPFVTGIASLIAYDLLRWWTKTRYPGLYALLSVKHYSAAGHAGGNGDDGDLTYYTAQGAQDDDTTPTPRN